jgi:hypothetical protein
MDAILISLLRTRTAAKRQRIAVANRLSALESGGAEHALAATQKALYAGISVDLRTLEKITLDEIRRRAELTALTAAARNVKGASALNLAPFIAYVDIARCERVATLWRYCGLAVIDGAAEKGPIGNVQHYNDELQQGCRELGATLLASAHTYYAVYLNKRIYYTRNRDWSTGHTHAASFRYMIKMFVSHVWETWRLIEGYSVPRFPVSESWMSAEDFGWTLKK